MAMRKAGLPALYELMGSRTGRSPRRRESPDEAPPPVTPDSSGSWLSPGRMLRLPVGYVLLASALVIALIVTAYVVGFRQASDLSARELERSVVQPPVDPLMTDDPLGSGVGAGVDLDLSRGTPEVDSSAPRGEAAAPTTNGEGWGPVFSDPREAGRRYIILMQTDRAGAERVVRFCRENGLETYAVSRNNARLYRVIALPGFSASEQSSERIRALEALIDRVGRKWKQEGGGTTDFHDRYPSLYTG